MRFARRIFSIGNAVTLITVVLGVAAAAGLTDTWWSTEKVLVALVTLVATQLLLDRVGVLSAILERVGGRSGGFLLELRPRTDPQFQRFADFAHGASELLVIGVDLGFMANADAWFVKSALDRGVRLKLLLIDPSSGDEVRRMVDNQDERNVAATDSVHDHVAGAAASLKIFEQLAKECPSGSIEVRARVDIPNPTMAFVDVREPDGRVRVELKLYKRNHGEVPYFVLDRASHWFEAFVDHYYRRLWADSPVLFSQEGRLG